MTNFNWSAYSRWENRKEWEAERDDEDRESNREEGEAIKADEKVKRQRGE
jgi:hypothetical protein